MPDVSRARHLSILVRMPLWGQTSLERAGAAPELLWWEVRTFG